MKIKNTVCFGVKLLIVALILQLVIAGSAFAFNNIDFGGGSTWYQDDSQNGSTWYQDDSQNGSTWYQDDSQESSAWWDAAWEDEQSSSFNGWGKQPVQSDRWWDW